MHFVTAVVNGYISQTKSVLYTKVKAFNYSLARLAGDDEVWQMLIEYHSHSPFNSDSQSGDCELYY